MKNAFVEKLRKIPSRHRLRGQSKKIAEKDVNLLIASGVDSLDSLIRVLNGRDSKLSLIACWALGKLEKSNYKFLIKILKGRKSKLWLNAAHSLSCLDSKQAVKPLLDILLHGKEIEQREATAYALGGSPFSRSQRLNDAFIRVLKNKKESVKVKGKVVEGLGYINQFSNKSNKHFIKALDVLIDALHDPSPEIRFWASFSLGLMKSKKAIPGLKKLVKFDKSSCPGMWSVKKEAADAIEEILSSDRLEREPGRIRIKKSNAFKRAKFSEKFSKK